MTTFAPEVGGYLGALTTRARAVLGYELVGVYAAGSLALDAYEPGRSDIDIAIICRSTLQLPIKEALVAALRHESLPCPARGLELVVYRGEIAAARGSDPGFEVELNTGSRMAFRATYAGPDRRVEDGTFWYAIDRSILAKRGVAVTGPPAAAVFRSVPEAALVELLIASLRWHLGQVDDAEPDPDQSGELASWTDEAVLNACRGWWRVRSGRWSGKVEAGREVLAGQWPAAGDPAPAEAPFDRAVVEQALTARTGGAPPSVRQPRRFQRAILAELQEIADAR